MKPMRAACRTPNGSRNPSERALIARPASSPAIVAPNMTPARSTASTQAFSPKKTTSGDSSAPFGSPPAKGAGTDGSRGSRSEHGGPVVLHADDGPSVAARLLEGGLGAGRVGELAVGVVVEDEQAQERSLDVLREVQHRAVAVAVAGGEQWSAADPAPDPDGLLGPVVEVVEHRGVGDGAAVLVACVGEGDGAADHALAGHAVELVADRSHEVAAPARGDVRGEPVGRQVVEELDHRPVDAPE